VPKLNWYFKTCGISAKVYCSQAVAPFVARLVDPFTSRTKASYELEIDHDVDVHSKRQLFRTGVRVPNDQLIQIRECRKGKLRITIRVVDAQVVSGAMGLFLTYMLAQNNGLLLHAAGLVLDGHAYVFIGPSGAGKSTVAQNARNSICFHDDKVAVRKIGRSWWACGVPLLSSWYQTGRNLAMPLDSLYLLRKSNYVKNVTVQMIKALEGIGDQLIIFPNQYRLTSKVAQTALDLVAHVPCFDLYFGKRSNVERVLHFSPKYS
jgi:hypothetical protein